MNVHDVVIVVHLAGPAHGPRRHAGGHPPAHGNVDVHFSRPVEPLPHRIHEEVRAVEEGEVGTRPRNRSIDRIGEVVERDRDRGARLEPVELPCLEIELVPIDRTVRAARREARHAAGEPKQLVMAGRPGGQREHDRPRSRDAEVHGDRERSLSGRLRVYRDLVRDISNRRRACEKCAALVWGAPCPCARMDAVATQTAAANTDPQKKPAPREKRSIGRHVASKGVAALGR